MSNFIPKYLANNVYEIDFDKLYSQGKKIILFDLDNTLASYDETTPTNKQLELNKKLRDLGYKIFIISNNHEKRTKIYTTTFIVDDYLILARKPFTRRTKKFLLKNNINKEEVVWIGDQLLTDVSCANKLDIDCVLVKSISRKSEKWYTKINRLREKRVLNKIAKKDLQLANSIKKIIGERDDVNE